MSVSYSNKFFLKPIEGSKRAKIFQRIIVNRQKAELYAGIEIEERLWEEASQRTKGNAAVNKRLSEKESELHNLIHQLEQEKKQITAKVVKTMLKGEGPVEVKLLDYCVRYIEGVEKDGEVTQVTIWGYKNVMDHLSNFIKTYGVGEDIAINQIDYSFLKKFDSFLLQQKAVGKDTTLKRNTVNKNHVRHRTILNAAVRERIITNNPYATFPLRDTPSQRKYLEEQDLQKLIQHDLGGNASLQKVRDIFIWSVYTGLRFTDAMNMEANKVKQDRERNYTFQFYQEKTGESVNVPLLPPAVEIFLRYDNLEREASGKVLPQISNQKVNTYLKVIGDLAGITTPITHHVARHTCATTVLLSNKIPLEIVSRWLGHNSVRTTQVYAKITNQAVLKAGQELSSKLFNGN
jgi:integrase/recombinase XerD